jgi:serine protease Do
MTHPTFVSSRKWSYCVALALIAGASVVNSSCRRSEPEKAPRAGMTSQPLSYANVVEHVAPAVVTVRSARRVRAPQQYPFFGMPFFGRMFGLPSNPERVERALGSGVIVRSDGHIVTNHHVIDGAQEIRVDLSNHRTYSARLVGSDPPSDLAVLKIDASGLPTLTLGDSDKVRVGDIVLAIGNPLGIGETVTAGIISAKGRRTGLSNGAFEDFLQTDAPINQGNSGGALVNTTGELIGINSQIISPTGGNIGIGFAIPSNMTRTVMGQLVKSGAVKRGHLGVTVQAVTPELAESLGLKEAKGVLISDVTPNSPAAKAGLKIGDVITAMNGQAIEDPNQFRNTVAGAAPGTEVTLTITREGKQQEVRVKLGELNPQESASRQGAAPEGGGQLGIQVQPVTPDIAAQLGLPENTQGLVVMSVDPAGPAAEGGIQPGDVIVEVNRQPVKSVADVKAALARSGGRPALIRINRQGQNLFLTVKPRQ